MIRCKRDAYGLWKEKGDEERREMEGCVYMSRAVKGFAG